MLPNGSVLWRTAGGSDMAVPVYVWVNAGRAFSLLPPPTGNAERRWWAERQLGKVVKPLLRCPVTAAPRLLPPMRQPIDAALVDFFNSLSAA